MSSNSIHARAALLDDGWAENVRLVLDGGVISGVEAGVEAHAEDERVDHLVPAMGNHHSHAFQRAMSGLAEKRGQGTDTFWTWRDVMYRFALAMNPDQMEAVAAQLYVEMVEAGFCRVGEFHYLHNDRDGLPYANRGEMSERIVAAAGEAGIGLTLLPAFYAHSNFGGLAPNDGQRRFINDLAGFEDLLARCRDMAATHHGVSVGVAPHSLRAVTPQELDALVAMAGDDPIHIHVAEQEKEVADCLEWCGQRPLEWLLAHAPVNERWCLIHSTHLTGDELDGIVHAGATVGLCPVTEGNLGDGVFPAADLLRNGGRFGIGTDSNVSVGVAGELRQLEYSQRLAQRQRSVVARQGWSSGRVLFSEARRGGQAALNFSVDIEQGAPATFVTFDSASVPWLSRDSLLDAWIFGDALRPDGVWIDGRQMVAEGRHVAAGPVAERFRRTMTELLRETGLQ
ncbi:formimidoylglutamate deiminase [Breoghania corrubedonensis]|uniref:Formimidoylglutamate deiminase n=1 Tax=Breoghania corrubedonensis TaxID=665038 RepID=A0A2T5V6F3_9HYPH|nr:formimidoylglutamate deiminase [Breoghania corrubedonensis]PTW59324.1 formimidoylglutamate deiminase [Breoghania corrubedonensis]